MRKVKQNFLLERIFLRDEKCVCSPFSLHEYCDDDVTSGAMAAVLYSWGKLMQRQSQHTKYGRIENILILKTSWSYWIKQLCSTHLGLLIMWDDNIYFYSSHLNPWFLLLAPKSIWQICHLKKGNLWKEVILKLPWQEPNILSWIRTHSLRLRHKYFCKHRMKPIIIHWSPERYSLRKEYSVFLILLKFWLPDQQSWNSRSSRSVLARAPA